MLVCVDQEVDSSVEQLVPLQHLLAGPAFLIFWFLSFSCRFWSTLLHVWTLIPVHSRSREHTPHMLMHEYRQENDKSCFTYFYISIAACVRRTCAALVLKPA
mgnify:CR=1 FL=1